MKIGVIGLGKWGKNHVRIYNSLDHEVLLYDIDKKRALDISKEFGGEVVELDYLLKNSEAVSIVVPSDLHYDIVKKCIGSNLHVMVEKPLCMDSNKVIELYNMADKKGVVLVSGHIFRFSDTVIELKKNFGEFHKNIKSINMRFLNQKPPRKDSNIIFNLAIHLFDILDFIFEKKAEKVFCKFDDRYGIILLDYGDFFANLEVGCDYLYKIRDIIVISDNSSHYDLSKSEKEPLFQELKDFISCINNNVVPVNSAKKLYSVIKMCELAIESNKTGKWVDVS